MEANSTIKEQVNVFSYYVHLWLPRTVSETETCSVSKPQPQTHSPTPSPAPRNSVFRCKISFYNDRQNLRAAVTELTKKSQKANCEHEQLPVPRTVRESHASNTEIAKIRPDEVRSLVVSIILFLCSQFFINSLDATICQCCLFETILANGHAAGVRDSQ